MTSPSLGSLERYDARLPIHQRLAAAIQDAVGEGRLKPGDPLPAESQLARDFQVALGTVRRAMDTLREDGLVERHQGRGTFVRQPDFAQSMLRFFRFGDHGGERPLGVVRRVSRASATPELAAALDLTTGADLVELERVRSLGGSPVAWETIWLPADTFAAALRTPPQDLPNLLYPWYQDAFGVLVAHAHEELTVDIASERDRELLDAAPAAPIVVIERVAQTLDRRPVERRITRGLTTNFRYRVEIS